MGEQSPDRRAGVILRTRSSTLVGAALLALVVVLLADALLRGRWDVAVLSLPALGLVVVAAVEVFLRPGLRLHPGGITVVNPLSTIEVPWPAIADVRTRFHVSIETRSGRLIGSWGAPAAPRIKPSAAGSLGDWSGGTAAHPGGSAPSSAAHRVIDSYWAEFAESAAREELAEPVHRWHWVAVGALVALVIVVIGQLVVGA